MDFLNVKNLHLTVILELMMFIVSQLNVLNGRIIKKTCFVNKNKTIEFNSKNQYSSILIEIKGKLLKIICSQDGRCF